MSQISTVLVTALFIFACKNRVETAASVKETAYSLDKIVHRGFTPASYPPLVKKGLADILSGKAMPYGAPEKLYQALLWVKGYKEQKEWLEKGFLPHFSEKLRSKMSLGHSRIQARGATLMGVNCFACHAGVIANVVVPGLGNTHINQAAVMEEVRTLNRVLQRVTGKSGVKSLQKLLNPLTAAESAAVDDFLWQTLELLNPAYRHTQTRGDNFGALAAWLLFTRLENPKTHGLITDRRNKSQYYRQLRFRPFPPVDPNPWWNVKYRQTAYWYGDAPNYDPYHFTLNFWVPVAGETPLQMRNRYEQIAVHTKSVMNFVRATKPPPYPFARREKLAALGSRYFHGEKRIQKGRTLDCAGCHGSYVFRGRSWHVDYPNLGRTDVGTDPRYIEFLQSFEHLRQKMQGFSTFMGRNIELLPVETKGYYPPPLMGVWASAPYFHNGSVPTLLEVLDPENRPQYWVKSLDPAVYDQDRGGLFVARPVKLARSDLKYKQGYDTTLYGRSNGGHDFGADLTRDERLAIVAFLKGLF